MTEKPRSLDQHKRFFGVIRALFNQWPEAHGFQPDNEEHLRAYVLVKSGHRSVKSFYVLNDEEASDFARLLPMVTAVMLNRYCWAWAQGDELRVAAPLTTNFKDMSHKEACAVYDKADEFIRSIGFDPDQLLKEAEKAA